MSWLVTYVSDIISKHLVGNDRKTAYERRHDGKMVHAPTYDSGEVVNYRLSVAEKEPTVIEPSWGQGV